LPPIKNLTFDPCQQAGGHAKVLKGQDGIDTALIKTKNNPKILRRYVKMERRIQTRKAGRFMNQSGFTLIELMVVAVILAIIAAIAVPIYNGYKKEAQTQEAYQVLTQWADTAIGKAIKAKETGQTTVKVPGVPNTGTYFNFTASPGAGADWTYSSTTPLQLTATGKSGKAVSGNTLKVNVVLTGNIPSKTFGGQLY
jgi:prepilin-type N-terminal cleavage/methylation domain-containing protein